MPNAHRLIHDSAFDPDTIKMMGGAFDAAWGVIQLAFKLQPQAIIDDAQNTLAKAIINRVRLGLLHIDILQEEAIGAVRRRYPSLRI